MSQSKEPLTSRFVLVFGHRLAERAVASRYCRRPNTQLACKVEHLIEEQLNLIAQRVGRLEMGDAIRVSEIVREQAIKDYKKATERPRRPPKLCMDTKSKGFAVTMRPVAGCCRRRPE